MREGEFFDGLSDEVKVELVLTSEALEAAWVQAGKFVKAWEKSRA